MCENVLSQTVFCIIQHHLFNKDTIFKAVLFRVRPHLWLDHSSNLFGQKIISSRHSCYATLECYLELIKWESWKYSYKTHVLLSNFIFIHWSKFNWKGRRRLKVWRTNKLNDTDTRDYIFRLSHFYRHCDPVWWGHMPRVCVSVPICPGPVSHLLSPCPTEAALSDSGLLLFILIVHYYDVSLLHNVIYKQSNMIWNAFTAAHISISIFPIEHYCQLPGLGHGSRSSPRCRYFLRQITKWLQPAVDTHPPPAFLGTLFRKASDIL